MYGHYTYGILHVITPLLSSDAGLSSDNNEGVRQNKRHLGYELNPLYTVHETRVPTIIQRFRASGVDIHKKDKGFTAMKMYAAFCVVTSCRLISG
jgi:hypothetical protein